MASKYRKIAPEDIVRKVFVRKALDSDRVTYFQKLIKSGVEFERIKVSQENVMIDGRHRQEAYIQEGVKEIMVEVIEVENDVELIQLAFAANLGGALPPSQRDYEHTVGLLLDRGVPKKGIADLLQLPSSLAREYVNEVTNKRERAKAEDAAALVREGKATPQEAAKHFDVSLDRVKTALGAKPGKSSKQALSELTKKMSVGFQGFGLRVSADIKNLLEKREYGDITDRQVREYFRHIDTLLKRLGARIADRKRRYEATTQTPKLPKAS